jgi:hypothetical protein
MFDICSPVSSYLALRETGKDIPRFCISSLFISHSLCTASRVRRAVELSACAVCFGLLRSVRTSSDECLLNLFGALSFEGRVEFSSSILYHSSQLPTRLGDWTWVRTGKSELVVSELLASQQDAYR